MQISVNAFLAALTYFTRIPSPIRIDATRIEGAACFAPIVGWLVGGIAAAAFAGAHLVFPIAVAVVISMAVSILVTGGLHEDGWMDFCDGFGAAADREQTLQIMRDSHSGAFAVLGAIVVLLLKFSTLSALASVLAPDPAWMLGIFTATLVAGHGSSRFAAVAFMYTRSYVPGNNSTKAASMAKRMRAGELAIAAICALLPVVLLGAMWSWLALLALLPVLVVFVAMDRMMIRRLGGYTGDCLGAVQQLSELGFYLAILSFIER